MTQLFVAIIVLSLSVITILHAVRYIQKIVHRLAHQQNIAPASSPGKLSTATLFMLISPES